MLFLYKCISSQWPSCRWIEGTEKELLMEKRQLDLNAPLLSVRRFSSPSNSREFARPTRQQSLPVTKSNHEYESTKPVAVPFHWEHVPGRAKDESGSSSHTPRLPPGRLSDAMRRSSGELPKLPPGRVPGSSRYSSGERLNDSIYRPPVESFSSYTDHANLLKKLNESLTCDNGSDTEGEDAYSDALDTLDYSVSGLSGCHSSGLESSGTFSVDKKTRDFMMDRFLPAAKAVVIETPQHVVKKPMVVTEQTKPLKKVVSGERNPLLNQYDVAPYYKGYYVESEDGDGELPPVRVKKLGKSKTWGILPKFCVKNSLCLLNPLQGLKSKTSTRSPMPSTGEIRRRLTRNAVSGPLDKNACPVPQKKKFHSGLLSRELPQIENKLTDNSYEFVHSRESHKSGLSTLRRYKSGSISPYRNESPRSPFREGAGFLGVPKEVDDHNANKIASSRKLFKALHDVSKNQVNSRELYPVEKIVHVDSVRKSKSLIPKSPVKKIEEYERFDLSGERLKFLEGIRKVGDAKLFEDEKKKSPRFLLKDVSDGMENVMVKMKKSNLPLEYTDAKFETKQEVNGECGDSRDLLKSPLPPPLPKSPSESWLWRTLANPFSNSRSSSPLRSKEVPKGLKTDPKWETIVKSSNPSNDHARYSAELVQHISRRQNKS